jgi:hypothetical protein
VPLYSTLVPQNVQPCFSPGRIDAVTKTGGHLGWVSEEGGYFGEPWTDRVITEWLLSVQVQLAAGVMREKSAMSSCDFGAEANLPPSYTPPLPARRDVDTQLTGSRRQGTPAGGETRTTDTSMSGYPLPLPRGALRAVTQEARIGPGTALGGTTFLTREWSATGGDHAAPADIAHPSVSSTIKAAAAVQHETTEPALSRHDSSTRHIDRKYVEGLTEAGEPCSACREHDSDSTSAAHSGINMSQGIGRLDSAVADDGTVNSSSMFSAQAAKHEIGVGRDVGIVRVAACDTAASQGRMSGRSSHDGNNQKGVEQGASLHHFATETAAASPACGKDVQEGFFKDVPCEVSSWAGDAREQMRKAKTRDPRASPAGSQLEGMPHRPPPRLRSHQQPPGSSSPSSGSLWWHQ